MRSNRMRKDRCRSPRRSPTCAAVRSTRRSRQCPSAAAWPGICGRPLRSIRLDRQSGGLQTTVTFPGRRVFLVALGSSALTLYLGTFIAIASEISDGGGSAALTLGGLALPVFAVAGGVPSLPEHGSVRPWRDRRWVRQPPWQSGSVWAVSRAFGLVSSDPPYTRWSRRRPRHTSTSCAANWHPDPLSLNGAVRVRESRHFQPRPPPSRPGPYPSNWYTRSSPGTPAIRRTTVPEPGP